MKRLRVFCLALLICSLAAFGYSVVKQFHGVDRLAPVIRMDSTTQKISVKDEEKELLKDVTATDSKDGDVTSSVVIESISNFLSDGRRIVTFAAFDSDGHVSKAEKQITYSDYTPPRFKLEKAMNFTTGSKDFLDGVSVSDSLDGNLTSSVKFSGGSEILTDVPGEYSMKLEVTNSAGDTRYLPLTVTIYDSSVYSQTPQINLKHYVVYLRKGEKIDLEKYLDSVTLYGSEHKIVSGSAIRNDTVGRNAIKISDKDVDYQKAGTYEAVYSMRSEQGQIGKTRLIIVVED